MQTRCPACRTVFRVTSSQLRARAGRVRCGQCRTVFDGRDELLDDDEVIAVATRDVAAATCIVDPEQAHVLTAALDGRPRPPDAQPAAASEYAAAVHPVESVVDSEAGGQRSRLPAAARDLPADAESAPAPRSGWLGPPTRATVAPPAGLRRFLLFACSALALLLCLQVLFHARGTLAMRWPALRPALAALSNAIGSDIPLPRHAQLISLEASDLQIDGEPDKLLALQVTLRNRAPYAQAYPALELSLTDTGDRLLARRVFQPAEYLSPALQGEQGQGASFAAGSDLELRLWLETRAIDAAGYRLYVFYP